MVRTLSYQGLRGKGGEFLSEHLFKKMAVERGKKEGNAKCHT